MRALATAAVVAAITVGAAIPAWGDTSAAVPVRVTVAAPCVSISWAPGLSMLDLGTLGFNTPSINSGMGSAGAFSVTNCGSAPESLAARTTNATSTTSNATWTPIPPFVATTTVGAVICNAGPNVFGADTDVGPGTLIELTTTDRLLKSVWSPSSTLQPHIDLDMPCAGSSGAGETMTFSVTYTASL
jgi:hypothetical protein